MFGGAGGRAGGAGAPRRVGARGHCWGGSAGSAWLLSIHVSPWAWAGMRTVLVGVAGPFPLPPCPPRCPGQGGPFAPGDALGWGRAQLLFLGPMDNKWASALGHQLSGHPGHHSGRRQGPREGAPKPESKNFRCFERKKSPLHRWGAAAPVRPALSCLFCLFLSFYFFWFVCLNLLLLSPGQQRH